MQVKDCREGGGVVVQMTQVGANLEVILFVLIVRRALPQCSFFAPNRHFLLCSFANQNVLLYVYKRFSFAL